MFHRYDARHVADRVRALSIRARIAVLAIVAAPFVLFIVPSASAAPTGCGPGWAGEGNTYVTAYCSGGTGSYQVWAQCWGTVWPHYYYFVQSSWYRAGSGATAWAWCPPGAVVNTWGIGRKN
jgi:hypothetical protein